MAPVQGTWTNVAASPSIRRSSQIAGVLDSRLVIYGGELKPREPVDNKTYLLDLSNSGEITTLDNTDTNRAPDPRVGSASAVANGVLYLFSGRGGPDMTPLDESGALWSLSLNSNLLSWRAVASKTLGEVPAPRSYHAMTSDGTQTVYLHAGCPVGDRLSDLWSFNIESAEWKRLANAPDPPRGGTSIAYAGGKLYRMGGFDGKTEQGGSIDIYDIGNDTWSTVTYTADNVQGPEARSVSCLVLLAVQDRQCLVTFAGERDPSTLGHAGAGKMLGDAWAWDLHDQTWSKIQTEGEAPSPRGWFAADVADYHGQSTLVVHGGLGEDNERLDDVWLLKV